jgi:hypothetical protein
VGYRFAGPLAVCASVVFPLACSRISGDDYTPVGLAPDASPGDASMLDATIGTASPDAGPAEAESDAESVTDAGPSDAEAGDDGGPCPLDPAGEPTDLRCTGLYSNWEARTVSKGVIEFDPGLHLWSDGAVKTRWIYLPPGTQIDTTNMDEWVFPVGTKLWKQFVVNGVLTETRLIHKTGPGTWYPTTYHWAPDGTSAVELTTGAINVADSGYEIPSQPKCRQCHQGRQDFVLGFEAVSLSSPGASGMPMATLVTNNLLTAPPTSPITVPGNTVESTALGYLHTNCGITCHNAGSGLAGSTGLYLRLNVGQLGSVAATDTVTTSWNIPTRGYHAVPDRIAQCNPQSSCVYFRLSQRDGFGDAGPGTQMPPIDTHQVDPAGVAIVAAWINEGCDAGTDGGP